MIIQYLKYLWSIIVLDKDIESTEILHIMDWPKSDFAAYLLVQMKSRC